MADDPTTIFQVYDPATRTGTIGLAFTSDEVMNRNLARIDSAIAELATKAGILPLGELLEPQASMARRDPVTGKPTDDPNAPPRERVKPIDSH